ncbi:hypothetical protein JCM10207_005771, partial [Rhodosporidiobolus poonsookiae]
ETVFTLPSLKDGASWAALEYAKNIRDPRQRRALSDGGVSEREPQDVVICVAGIAYSDKTKYRSCAVMEFGPNISVEPYVDEFLVSPKTAVKKLTQRIFDEMSRVTVNAPDWESRHAATMARKVLWPDDRKLPLKHLREIDQTLIDLFAAPNPSPSLVRLATLLTTYRDALNTTALTHLSLSSLPLPSVLDPSIPHPLPTRMRVLSQLLLSTLSCLIRLPFFLLPLLVHLPVYLFARYASSGALEEDQAQNKVAAGLVFCLGTYAAFFAVSCALLWTSIPWGGGLLVALAATIVFGVYHTRLIDDNYRNFQRFLALWTVLIGLWSPVAHSEAHHFLASVPSRLSLSLPRNSAPQSGYNSDTPYADGDATGTETEMETDDERGALLASSSSSPSSASAAPKRAPLPSPALFSEQDRLLGAFPLPSPSPAPLSRQGSHSRRASRHVVPVSSSAGETETEPAQGPPSAADQSLAARRRRSQVQRRSRAAEMRALLRLRVETVAALRETLFGFGAEGDGDEDEDVQRVLDLSARAAAEQGEAGPLEVREREVESRRRAREAGERMREWGWKGAGLGVGKLR